MILEFKMKNVYSYRNELTYSMLAPNNKVKNRYKDNYSTMNGFDVLKTAVIVGENAGGKSNFIKGLQYFKSLFKESSEQIKSEIDKIFNEDILVRINDKENSIRNNEITQEFSIILTSANGLVYKYRLVISIYGIEHESLLYTDDKNHVFKKVFDVDAYYDNEKGYETKKLILDIPANKKIQELVIDNFNAGKPKGLIVNSLSVLGIPHTAEFINEIDAIIIQKNMFDMPVGLQYQLNQDGIKPDLELMKTNEFIEIFRMVDSSIVGLEIDDEAPLFNSLIIRVHSDGAKSKRPIASDSTGVKNFLVMSILIYKVVYDNTIIFNDEMDSTFNPVLTSKVISFIHSFDTKGQFIFTTHNIFNLTFQTFMKEQMFIVEKDKELLESKLYSLGEFDDLRYDSNEKIYEYYLKGVLGGVDSGN